MLVRALLVLAIGPLRASYSLAPSIRKIYGVGTHSAFAMGVPEEEFSEELDRAIALSLQEAFDRELPVSDGNVSKTLQNEGDDLVIVGESKAEDVTSSDHALAVRLQEDFASTDVNDDSSKALALSLQQDNEMQESGATMSAELLRKRFDPMCVVDAFWEKADPTPNIHSLFVDFDTMFFQKRLTNAGVAVSWGPRMTLSVLLLVVSKIYFTWPVLAFSQVCRSVLL